MIDAISIARAHGIFEWKQQNEWPSRDNGDDIQIVNPSHFGNLDIWQQQMKAIIHAQYNEQRSIATQSTSSGVIDSGNVSLLNANAIGMSASVFAVSDNIINIHNSSDASVDELNLAQKRAYNIISSHLNQFLTKQNPTPLRLIIYGEGGTGKSKVIEAITLLFERAGCRGLLIKSVYTGMSNPRPHRFHI